MKAADRTLSEIRALCTKAARGVGCPWGLAEEAGMAARILHAHGLPGCEALAALFATPRDCGCEEGDDKPTCGLVALAALSDALPERAAELGDVAGPLLLLAPLLQEAQSGFAWRVEWDSGFAECAAAGPSIEGRPAPKVSSVRITRLACSEHGEAPSWRSRAVSEQAWEQLEALAARTYVPESETSREGGAGPDAADTD
ncbi:MAG: DUF3726 domain-containing protein [Pseudomonadota bacterium]